MSNVNRRHRRRAALAAALIGLAAPAAQADPQQDTEQAEKEFARGNLVVSMQLWRKAANEGYAPAQARLGDILDKAEEDAEAVNWYRKAAEQDNAAGELGLGLMYGKGEGVKRDDEQARKYIMRAAQKDYLPAVIVLVEMYKSGTLGTAPDPALAAQWKAKADALYAKEKALSRTEQGAK